MGIVGTNVERKDGAVKVRGQARYLDDISVEGLIYGRTIRSPIACGTLRALSCDLEGQGFVVVRAEDIPGRNVVTLIEEDQPFLAAGVVRHKAEPILLLAHEDRRVLAEAQVGLDLREEEPLLDPLASTHVFKEIWIDKGDVEAAFAGAARVVEGTYRTGHQEQLYIEPQGALAVPEDDGGVTVYGSLQCPYYVVKALSPLLNLPPEKVRVIQAETGGGFGGKEDYPSLIAGHAALLALKAGRPVKLVYDRREDMWATTKRHPSIVRHRTAIDGEGRLVAMDIEVVLDAGAYCTLSPVVLSRGVIHAAGPYRCDNIRIRGRAVRTNTPPNGAFRGFGAPQTLFAVECHMERVAAELGVDGVEFRRRHALRPGDTTATGQVMRDDCAAVEVLDEAVRRSRFRAKRRRYAGTNRGIGLALFYHGAGFTGEGEVVLASRAALELNERGIAILVASTEIGQGTRTILSQIVADTLRVRYSDIYVADQDTGRVPDSGPTVASRTCMVVGGILQAAARDMRRHLAGRTPRQAFAEDGPIRIEREYTPPAWVRWDEKTYSGDAYATYGWGCYVVELELDPDTFQVRPLCVTAVQDVGRTIHPILARGQVEGGVNQGLGFALLEEVVMEDGEMVNASLANYIIPTTMDTPRIDVAWVERPYAEGPFGAKGLGELPMDGPAPAVANALRSLGFDVREVPATPERLYDLAVERDDEQGGS